MRLSTLQASSGHTAEGQSADDVALNEQRKDDHRHSREDEYSFVLEGRMGADLGGEIVYAETGDLIFKPRGQWHAFWNAGDRPARILEIISPAGFEKFFDKVTDLAARGELDPARMATLAAEYGTEVDLNSVPGLVAAHGVRFAMGPQE